MLPLLVKDGVLVPTLAASVICYEVIRATLRPFHDTSMLLKILHLASVSGVVALVIVSQTLTPPAHLPDLHALVITTFSFAHFAAFLLYFHYLQFTA